MMEEYHYLLEEENLIDFAKIQTECYRLLADNPDILSELQEQIKYLMIDEYQDTNYIQEQIVFMLGSKHGNICVVGDDDQGLYRFRGATIRNILEFPHKFPDGKCKIIPLVVNYRSKELKAKYPQIRYTVVLAYMPDTHIKELYGEDTLFPDGMENVPKKFAISKRNDWMIQQSGYAVCYVYKVTGSAAKFRDKAEKNRLRVIDVLK